MKLFVVCLLLCLGVAVAPPPSGHHGGGRPAFDGEGEGPPSIAELFGFLGELVERRLDRIQDMMEFLMEEYEAQGEGEGEGPPTTTEEPPTTTEEEEEEEEEPTTTEAPPTTTEGQGEETRKIKKLEDFLLNKISQEKKRELISKLRERINKYRK